MRKAETKDRIKKALEIREMKQSELVEKTGIDKGQMSSYLSGRYKPKQTNLHLIAEALSVDEAWLMGFDVPMDQADYNLGNEQKKQMIEFSKKWDIQYLEKEMLESFSQLTDVNKKRTIQYTENLLQLQKAEEELTLNAAHDNGATAEQKANADSIMTDDDEWE